MARKAVTDELVLQVAAELRARFGLDNQELRLLGARLMGTERIVLRVASDTFVLRFAAEQALTLERIGDA